MPPPTRQGSRPQIDDTISALSPLPIAGVEIDQLHAREPRELLDPRLGVAARMASFSPCTSCTTAPFCRSIEGMSIRDEPECRARADAV
jgi:hypothetical protein